MFLIRFHFSFIGTSHLLNCFLFDVNCDVMLSFCLPLILSFLQSTLSIISYFIIYFVVVSIAYSPLLIYALSHLIL